MALPNKRRGNTSNYSVWLPTKPEGGEPRRIFKGYLHVDGYDGYHRLPDNITVVGCWAHARRKFDELLQTIPKDKRDSSAAAKGIAYCDKLFRFEKQFALLSPEDRFKERERFSKPLMDEFYAWLGSLREPPKSLMGKAIYYAESQRKYLERICLTVVLKSATTAPKEQYARLLWAEKTGCSPIHRTAHAPVRSTIAWSYRQEKMAWTHLNIWRGFLRTLQTSEDLGT